MKFYSYISGDLKCHFLVKSYIKNINQPLALIQNFSYRGNTVVGKRRGEKKKVLPESSFLLDAHTRYAYKKIPNYSNNIHEVRALHIPPLPLRFLFV